MRLRRREAARAVVSSVLSGLCGGDGADPRSTSQAASPRGRPPCSAVPGLACRAAGKGPCRRRAPASVRRLPYGKMCAESQLRGDTLDRPSAPLGAVAASAGSAAAALLPAHCWQTGLLPQLFLHAQFEMCNLQKASHLSKLSPSNRSASTCCVTTASFSRSTVLCNDLRKTTSSRLSTDPSNPRPQAVGYGQHHILSRYSYSSTCSRMAISFAHR